MPPTDGPATAICDAAREYDSAASAAVPTPVSTAAGAVPGAASVKRIMIDNSHTNPLLPALRAVVPACVFLLAGHAWSASPPASAGFAVLAQPALASARATQQAMLAVTRAGARLVAVGEQGIVLLSDDNGASWRQARVPVSVSLTAVRFVDARHGWAVGHLGTVLHSADGGETWVKQLDGVAAAQRVLKEAEARARDAGEETREAAERGLRNARRLVEEGPDKPFLDVHFTDTRTGFVLGAYNQIFRTDDGGLNWRPWHDRMPNPDGFHLYGMSAAQGVLLVVGEQGTLLRSRDGGEHFEALESPYAGSFFGVISEPGGAFIAFGLRGNAFRSDDRGDTWQRVDTGQSESLSAGTVLADGSPALVSQAGELLVSRDAGRSFGRVPDLPALPLAGLAQAADGAVVGASLVGAHRLGLP